MDIFEVLAAILKSKKKFMHTGISEQDALKKAELDISKEYHIPLSDIEKLVGQRFDHNIHRHRRSFS